MLYWFKSFHGQSDDPKFHGIAAKLGLKPLEVSGLNWVLRNYASQNPDRGSIAGFSALDAGAQYRMRPEKVEAVITAMRDRGILIGDRFADWDQQDAPVPDRSRDRTRRYRARQRTSTPDNDNGREPEMAGSDPGVTAEPSRERHGDDAVTGSVTSGDVDSKTQNVEEEIDAYASKTRAGRRDPDEFERWWQEVINKVGKGAAEKAYWRARDEASAGELVVGLREYQTGKPADRQWCNPSTWLNARRWLDEPPPPVKPPQRATGGHGGGAVAAATRVMGGGGR